MLIPSNVRPRIGISLRYHYQCCLEFRDKWLLKATYDVPGKRDVSTQSPRDQCNWSLWSETTSVSTTPVRLKSLSLRPKSLSLNFTLSYPYPFLARLGFKGAITVFLRALMVIKNSCSFPFPHRVDRIIFRRVFNFSFVVPCIPRTTTVTRTRSHDVIPRFKCLW
jgi:hypothetical protein